MHGITTRFKKLYSRRVSSATSNPRMAPITEVFGSAVFELRARSLELCFKLKLMTMKALSPSYAKWKVLLMVVRSLQF